MWQTETIDQTLAKAIKFIKESPGLYPSAQRYVTVSPKELSKAKMLLNDNIDEFIKVRMSGEIESGRKRARLWGNLFLTDSWTLLIDLVDEPHCYTCERLGLRESSALLSGRWEAFSLAIVSAPLRVVFRSSPGADNGKITEDENQMLMKACRRVAIKSLQDVGSIQELIGK